MLLKTATQIILHEKEKLAAAVAGVALAVFLVVVQWGFYFGYQRDITVVLDAFDADIWIIPKGQPMFDGYAHIDDLVYWAAKQSPDLDDVGRIVWGDAQWRNPLSGGKDYVQVLGVDFDSGVKCRIGVQDPDGRHLLQPDGHILIARKDREKLGVQDTTGKCLEISGRSATVVGYVDDVHLFTTAGFVMTDLDNARAFLRLPPSYATYIICKCRAGVDVRDAVRRLQATVPEHDVITSREFHQRATNYWETRSGFGPVILLSSILAVIVGFLIVMLTFYISTIEKIPLYACMKALGGSTLEIVFILIVQIFIVFILGCSVGAGGVYLALFALRQTTISVTITPELIGSAVGTMFLCSIIGAMLSIRKLVATEPGEAFRT